MRKIFVSMMVSIDGYIAGRDESEYWHNWDDQMAAYIMDMFDSVDMFIYGRKSYEEMIEYWPDKNDQFAVKMNNTPKLIYSRSLNNVTWNSTLKSDVDVDEIMALKSQPGKDIVIFAGATIVEAFAEKGLIDEYRLVINPVVLGGGKPLFATVNSTKKFKLLSTRIFDNGNILVSYQPV